MRVDPAMQAASWKAAPATDTGLSQVQAVAIALVDLGHQLHVLGAAQLEDAPCARNFSRAGQDAQHPAADRGAHQGVVALGCGAPQMQAGGQQLPLGFGLLEADRPSAVARTRVWRRCRRLRASLTSARAVSRLRLRLS
jgi:hypothetical protein